MSEELQSLDMTTIDFFSLKGLESNARLYDVIDGDTIIVIFKYGSEFAKFRVRLAAINSEELNPKQGSEEQKEEKRLRAKHASEYLTHMLCGTSADQPFKDRKVLRKYLQETCIIVDIRVNGYDKYGRILGEVYRDDVHINSKLIEKGYAEEYKK